MSSTERTNYLDKFGAIEQGIEQTDKSVPSYNGDLSDLSDVDITPLTHLETQQSVHLDTQNEHPVTEVAKHTEEQQLSSFDRMCMQATEIGEHTDSLKRKCKKALNRVLSNLNASKNLKYFQKGSMVICGDFKFLVRDKNVMLLKYTGNDSFVVVPDTVGGLPVTLIHETAFNKGRFVATTKLKNFVYTVRSDNVSLYTLEGMHYAIQGVQRLQLPKYLQMIPNYLFKHLTALTTIEIPDAVTNIAPNAFRKCNIERLIFSNPCVKNMQYVGLPENAEIFVKTDNARTYKGVLL